jgi:hypothetical protein
VVLMVTSKSLKLPSTSDTDKWVTVNLRLECILSSFQVPCANSAVCRVTKANRRIIFFIADILN